MSNDSRIAVSFAPAYFHHWRSNSRISRSRSPRPAAVSRLGCAAASMCLPSWRPCRRSVGRPRHLPDASRVYARNHIDVIQLRRVAGSRSDEAMSTSASTSPTRWGILATGKIAHSFATNLHAVPDAVFVAVGSRSQEAADAFATELGDDRTRAHGSYEALVADPDVDVVYVASPHSY